MMFLWWLREYKFSGMFLCVYVDYDIINYNLVEIYELCCKITVIQDIICVIVYLIA